jgi:hypothetical protein
MNDATSFYINFREIGMFISCAIFLITALSFIIINIFILMSVILLICGYDIGTDQCNGQGCSCNDHQNKIVRVIISLNGTDIYPSTTASMRRNN